MSQWVKYGTIGLSTGMGLAAWTDEQMMVYSLFIIVVGIIWSSLFPDRKKILVRIFGVLALWGGMFLYEHEFELWHVLPETIEFAGDVEILKRGEVNVFYRPILLQPQTDDWRGGDILYRAPVDAIGMPGERMWLECVLSRPKNFEPGFDYRNLLASRGTGYTCERGATAKPLPSTDFNVRKVFGYIQSSFRHAITNLIPEPEAGLLSGLLIGGSDTLAPETKQAFAQAGLSHIVAVSGYNMSIVAEGFVILALVFGAWRRFAVGIAVLGLAFFLLFIDGSAASLRAALMAWLAFGAYFVGRPAASLNGLFLAAAGMLISNPLLIRYDVGFQLSFLATLALLFFVRSFETFDFFRHWYGKIVALFLTTVSIELFTFPVILSTFGTFSVVAPLANALILPLVPIAMFVGIGAVVLTMLLPGSMFLVLPLVWLPLAGIILLAEGLAQIPGASLSGLDISPVFALLWYVGIGGGVVLLEYYRKQYVLGLGH